MNDDLIFEPIDNISIDSDTDANTNMSDAHRVKLLKKELENLETDINILADNINQLEDNLEDMEARRLDIIEEISTIQGGIYIYDLNWI